MWNEFKLNSFNIFLLQIGLHKFVQQDITDPSKSSDSSIYDVIAEKKREYMEQKPGWHKISVKKTWSNFYLSNLSQFMINYCN